MEEWRQLHGKLAEVAAVAGDDPTTAVQALLKVAKGASSSETLAKTVSKVEPILLKDLVRLVAGELDMTPLGDSEPVHMVDMDSNFCKANVDGIINGSAELSADDAPYAVISIVGAQSSGKTYLLNSLFGTKFPVMNVSRGRSQTTRGIMISRCIEPSLLVMDVEGFDGNERAQNTAFEKQAALFALTISDLMMVNISVYDIGREQGGSTGLFRTIFQERSKLPPGFTKILVVLRFYDEETPLQVLRSHVLRSLEKIWDSVNMESAKFKDYIEINIVGLPDKRAPEFPKEVTELRKLLSVNRSAKFPASGFSHISSIFWDTIMKNNELNIPSHQVALATLYCRQLVEDTVNSLKSQEKNRRLTAKESPRRFKEISHELLENITTEYDLKTKMYDPDVRAEERHDLVKRVQEIIIDDSRQVIREIQESTLEKFKRDFDVKTVKNIQEADPYLSKYVDKFLSSCEDLKVFDPDYLHVISRELKNNLESHTALAINMIKDYSRGIIRKVQKSTLEQFERDFKAKPVKNMQEAGPYVSTYVHKFTISCEDLKVYDTDYLQEMSGVLRKNLESYADQEIKIMKDDSRAEIRKVQKTILEKFKKDLNLKAVMNIKDTGSHISQEIDSSMKSYADTDVFDTEYLHEISEVLRKNLESYAAQSKDIMKEDSRPVIRKEQESTLEQFKRDFDAKRVKNIKDADPQISKYVAKFMSSCEDQRVFDTDYLHEICGMLRNNLESYTALAINERSKLPPGFTKILVVLRFYDEETPLQVLRSHVLRSLEKIWDSVNMESAKFKDYIEINIVGLPDKRAPEFPKEVTELRKLLSVNRSAKFPASGFSHISSIFWDTIMKNNELNIPSHQVALATLYCRQLVEDTVNSLKSQEKNRRLTAKESPRRFKEISHELLENITTEYDLKTKMYDPDVRAEERHDLVKRVQEIIIDDSRQVIREIQESTLEKFKRDFDVKTVKNIQEADPYLSKYVDKFLSSCEDLKVFDPDYLHVISRELKNNLESHTALAINMIKDYSRGIIRKVQKSTLEQFERDFKAKPVKNMQEAGPYVSTYVHKFTISCEDLKVYDTDYLQEMSGVLRKNLESYADQEIKIMKDDSRAEIRKVQKTILEKFKKDLNLKAVMNIKDTGSHISQEIDSSMKSYADTDVFDTEYLHEISEVLRKNLESYAAQSKDIMKEDSRPVIRKEQESTLEQFKRDFDAKRVKNIKDADPQISKYVAKFMSSCEDQRVFDTDYLHEICGMLRNNLESYTALAINERSKLPPGFTKILVVLRFYDEETPLQVLRSHVLRSLEKIWDSVNMESAKFKDYIEINIVGLPDKRAPEFPKEVTELRKLLSVNRSAKFPASGFSHISSIFWDTIMKNNELNIPSHQVALATLYCRQLVEDTVNSLKSQEKNRRLTAKESPRRFKEISHELLENITTEYDLKTKMYDPDVRAEERHDLVKRVQEIIIDDSRQVIREIQESTLEKFKRDFDVKTVKNIQEADPYLSKYVDKFLSSCEDLKVFDPDYLHVISRELKNNLESHTALAINMIKDYSRGIIRKVQKSTLEQFERDFKAKPVKNMQEAGPYVSTYVHKFTISCEDLKVYDTDYLQEMSGVLRKNLESYADQEIKIMKDDSRAEIRKVQKTILEKFKKDLNLKAVMNIKDTGSHISQEIDSSMKSYADTDVFDTEYLHEISEVLRKNLESYAAQSKDIMKEDSRPVIRKEQESTLEQFKRDFDAKRVKNIKDADPQISKYVAKFMSSCEDQRVFDTDYLHEICGMLRNNLESYTALAINEESRRKAAKKEERDRYIRFGVTVVTSVLTLGIVSDGAISEMISSGVVAVVDMFSAVD